MNATQRSSVGDVLNVKRKFFEMELCGHNSVFQHLHVLDFGVEGA